MSYSQKFVEFVDKDGFVCIRLPKKKRISKHRYLYQQYHNCEVQKGEVVIFLNGNNRDFSIENLYKVTRGELATLNKVFHGVSTDREETLMRIEVARIKHRRIELAREKGLPISNGMLLEERKESSKRYARAHPRNEKIIAWHREKMKDKAYRDEYNRKRREAYRRKKMQVLHGKD